MSVLPSTYRLTVAGESFTDLTSSHLGHLLSDRLLALKLSANCHCILHMGHVALPRSRGSRIPGRSHVLPFSKLRHQSRFDSVRQRTMDVCGWIPRTT